MKKNISLRVLVFLFVSFLVFSSEIFNCSAEEALGDLDRIVGEYSTKNDYEGLYNHFSQLLAVEGSGSEPRLYYYRALARYLQIEHWKKSKNWEGVFDKADQAKKEITQNLLKAQGQAGSDPELLFDITVLRWESVKDDDPARSRGLFNDVVNIAKDFRDRPGILDKVLSAADRLSSLEDKIFSRSLYDIYIENMGSVDLPQEQIRKRAEDFFNKGNAYLGKNLFLAYLERLGPDEDLLGRELVDFAGRFADKGSVEALDPFYAEELYARAAGMPKAEAYFDETSAYARAFNLERLKEYGPALKLYDSFLSAFESSDLVPEVLLRAGIISVYANNDLPKGLAYFEKLKTDFAQSPYREAALYQLGVLTQRKKEWVKAKEQYQTFLDEVAGLKTDYIQADLVSLASQRIAESEVKKDFKYPQKIFLETILPVKKPEVLSPVSVDLTARPSVIRTGQEVRLTVTTSNPQTGCMVPSFSYEWSGQTGDLANLPNAPELSSKFDSPGLKMVQVTVVGPQGPEGAAFEMILVHPGPEAPQISKNEVVRQALEAAVEQKK